MDNSLVENLGAALICFGDIQLDEAYGDRVPPETDEQKKAKLKLERILDKKKQEEQNDKKKLTKYVSIPDQTEVDFADLVVVDPKTFVPVDVPPNTQQLLEEANDVLTEVKSRTVTAYPDPNDPGALILSYPLYLLDENDSHILVLPVEG